MVWATSLARSACTHASGILRQLSVAAAPGTTDIVFVIGAPGVGKGTQCQLLCEQHGMGHISAGDLLRQAIQRGDAQSHELHGIIQEGRIVPAHVCPHHCINSC